MALRKERTDPTKSLVGFIVGDIAYAVPIGSVREIVNPGRLTALPHLPPSVAGVADHRGEVIVVVDLRARFGLGASFDQARTKWVLLTVGDRVVGLIVDQVTEVFGTGSAPLLPAPKMGGGEDVRGITGVINHNGVLTFVLDVTHFEAITRAIPREVLESIFPERA